MNKRVVISGVLTLMGAGLLTWFVLQRTTVAPSPSFAPTPREEIPHVSVTLPSSFPSLTGQKAIHTNNISRADKAFTFGATIPRDWIPEAVPGSNALSFYDPDQEGRNTLDQSQIFMRSFTANDFLTLSTVTIHSRQNLTINGRPAVRYDIEKKLDAAPFLSQPEWRNSRHIVTDIRTTDDNPSVFYVIAKRPDLEMTTYEAFLESLTLHAALRQASLVTTVREFRQRITKKPFGIFITPQSSPVQPERFNGFHTGVDVEYEDVTDDISVHAITDGIVEISQTADGYGGVIAIRHTIDGEQVISIYGHLRPSSLLPVKTSVTAGQQVGELGSGGTDETDGERKHLHFALVRGNRVDLRGYVESETELTQWLDPLVTVAE